MMIPDDLNEAALRELRLLVDALLAVEVKWGELGPEARMLWLDAEAFSASPALLRETIRVVAGVVRFVENWSDCARSGTPSEDDDWTEIEAAAVQCGKALAALLAIADYLRTGRG